MKKDNDYKLWRKSKLEKRYTYILMTFMLVGASLYLAFALISYLYRGGDIDSEFIWTSVLDIFLLLISYALFSNTPKKPLEEGYLAEQKEKAELKAKEEAKEKEKADNIEKVKKILEDSNNRTLNKSLTVINKNIDELMSMNFIKPSEFKSNVAKYENEITTKGNEYLHKFVKISTFLDELHDNLIENRLEIKRITDPQLTSSSFKAKINYEQIRSKEEALEDIANALKRKSEGDFKDYSAKGFLIQLEKLSKRAVPSFTREFAKINYLQAMANSMLVFLLEGKKIYFFEILDSFDKLGVFDSSWQKSLSKSMNDIESKLSLLVSGISNLNSNLERLTEKSNDISKQLKSINSGISTNNMLQAITAYQVYRINKNTKTLDN